MQYLSREVGSSEEAQGMFFHSFFFLFSFGLILILRIISKIMLFTKCHNKTLRCSFKWHY